MKTYIFTGKGGVGKSTLAVGAALHLARASNTLLISIDPAHNLSDIFEQKIGDSGRRVNTNLFVIEMNLSEYLRNMLKNTETLLQKENIAGSVFGIKNLFRAIEYAPGMEENAILLGLDEILHRESKNNFEQLIIDTPPTALALRLVLLPNTNIQWMEVLRKLRRAILDKKNMVAHIKNTEIITGDRVLDKINFHLMLTRRMQKLFNESTYFIVHNGERLSYEEGRRIKEVLNKNGFRHLKTVLNQRNMQKEKEPLLRLSLSDIKIPYINITGSDALEKAGKLIFL